MARLSWSVLWTAFAIVAATPNDYGYGYSNYVQQPQPEIPNADVTTDSGFCAGKENGAYSNGNGCVKDYWLCWDGLSTSQECPLDLMFNDENGQCDYASSILACGGERPTTQLPADSPTMEPVDFDCSGKEDGDYPYSDECRVEYVSCVAGAAWARSCPLIAGSDKPVSFDPETRICNWLENIVACGGSPPTASEPAVLDYECPSPSGSFALVSALCSPTYYICEDNKPIIAVCSDDMIWDDSHKACRMPADTDDCSFECTGKADAAYSIGCSQNYWWCWEGKASKLACPEGMVFNGENSQCDFDKNVFECTGQRVTPAPAIASDFATPPPVDFDCSTVKDGNHAFQYGAQCLPKFVSCVGGVAWEMTCPDGLLFDPDQELCERVDRIVACGGSLAEETTKAYDNSYSSYNKPTTPRPAPRKIHKTTLAARSITRGAYYQKKTTTAAEPTTELPSDNYGDYEATTLAEPTTTRRRHHVKTTTPAAEPTTRRSYYQTTTPAAEPTTELPSDNYGDYEATTLAERTTRRRHHKTTTLAAEPTTRRSYYQTTTPAAEPTTERPSDNYGDYEATTLAEPTTTRRRHHIKTTTPAAEPTTRRSYYQTTTLADEPVTTTPYDDGYGSYDATTPAAEPITTTRRSSYGQKRTTTLADEPIIRDSYYQTTPAAEPTTKQSYKQPIVRRLPKTTVQPVIRRNSYSKATPAAQQPRASYSQKKITPAAQQPTRASYSQKKITPAAQQPTRASYSKKITPAAQQPTRASYYQTTTPAAEPTTTLNSYSYEASTPAAEPITTTRRSSYGQKRTTTLADVPITRGSYYQAQTRLAEQPTRQPRPVIRRRIVPKPTAAQPIVRQSYYQPASTPAAQPVTRGSYNQKRLTPAADVFTRRSNYGTTPAAEPVTRGSYYQTTPAAEPTTRQSYYQSTPAAEPVTRRTYKLAPTAEEPTTRKSLFKQSSYY